MNQALRIIVLGAVFSGSAFTPVAHAEGDSSPSSTSANVGLYSQYVFRGIGYTQENPAVQGGFDLSHESGLYLGIWGTNVSDAALNNAAGEIDIYGGYAGQVGDFGYDVGFLQFLFPGGEINGTNESYNTLELYAGVSWGPVGIKYSHTVTDYFGFNNKTFGQGRGGSSGSNYIEANVGYEFAPGWTAIAHAGRQHVENYSEYSFNDWKLGVAYAFGSGWEAGLAWVDTSADSDLYTVCDDNSRCKNTGKGKVLAHIKRTF